MCEQFCPLRTHIENVRAYNRWIFLIFIFKSIYLCKKRIQSCFLIGRFKTEKEKKLYVAIRLLISFIFLVHMSVYRIDIRKHLLQAGLICLEEKKFSILIYLSLTIF